MLLKQQRLANKFCFSYTEAECGMLSWQPIANTQNADADRSLCFSHMAEADCASDTAQFKLINFHFIVIL